MIDDCVNSDWAKTVITMFMLKIIKGMPNTTFTQGGFIRVDAINSENKQSKKTDLNKN